MQGRDVAAADTKLPPVTIALRPLGSPLTVGMSGLGIASLVESGLALGWVASAQEYQVGLIMLAVPFVLQLLACIFSYLARDGAVAACVGVLSTTWLAVGLLHLVNEGGRDGALGLLLLASAGALLLSSAAVSTGNPLAAVIFCSAGLRFAIAAVYELGGADYWQDVSAVVGLAVTGLTAYAVVAFELEGQARRPVLPTFRRGRGLTAVRGPLAAQIDDVQHEPGVRQAG